MSILFTATQPERVEGLVLIGSFPCGAQADDWPLSRPPERIRAVIDRVEREWGTGKVFSRFVQHSRDPDAAVRLIARFERNACTPQMAAQIARHNFEIDVRPALATISVPTLVIHATGDPAVPFENGRYLAENIEGAELVVVDGDFHGSWDPSHVALWREAVIEFLGAAGTPTQPADRVLAAVLFTDIVDSTGQAARLGDSAWHNLLDRHDRIVGGEAQRCNGRLVKSTGDGALIILQSPSSGIDCARAITDALRPHDIGVRSGLHVGEVELRGQDVTGLGVVIASRICDHAEGGQILVSRTVKDLVAGSDTQLAAVGEHRLKGVPDAWQLYELT